MNSYCVVQRHKGKDTGRSACMSYEDALALCRDVNRSDQDFTWSAYKNRAHVELASTVQHLPINIS